ncbi:metallophosphatase family protein [Rhizobiaceae bacterium BDR2-2]|uniref:Metallophosphatase family protein n=1 Tax=Ectorhizobium quercum TaxID=2965071 RepID=A0AAE3SU36_9HYPH|nr:metallophosphoesterase family protein [Ectorhizobium quercum]MCX8996652.1 metallophosphatase family protein [Ectorhizobium quercum]
MRLAVIADVHGNAAALEAVLADIDRQGITDIVNLGDCFSGPLEAGRTADILLSRAIPTVCGNHDRALIDRPFAEMGDWERPARAQLSPAHLDWIGALPFSLVWRDEVYLCHATPQDDNTYWTEALTPEGSFRLKALEEIKALAEGIEQTLILCGHSHIARSVLLSGGRLLVNPGSVGCPGYDYDQPWYHKAEAGTLFACYAIVEKTARGWQPAFRQVRYDNEAMARLSEAAGLKDWTSALRTGWVR